MKQRVIERGMLGESQTGSKEDVSLDVSEEMEENGTSADGGLIWLSMADA